MYDSCTNVIYLSDMSCRNKNKGPHCHILDFQKHQSSSQSTLESNDHQSSLVLVWPRVSTSCCRAVVCCQHNTNAQTFVCLKGTFVISPNRVLFVPIKYEVGLNKGKPGWSWNESILNWPMVTHDRVEESCCYWRCLYRENNEEKYFPSLYTRWNWGTQVTAYIQKKRKYSVSK